MQQRATMIRLALIQLYSAVEHYCDGNFVSAITLAGAAEEILGAIGEKRKNISTVLMNKLFDDKLAKSNKRSQKSKSKIAQEIYPIKNLLKHNDNGINRIMKADFKFEAESLIVGAVTNYQIITGKLPRAKLIREVHNHICG
ncbi:MAG: hypothetical protein JST75_14960 [Bacteroidetes bacterium]|nr:hypothetical protein [Bacteroidota bacterium]